MPAAERDTACLLVAACVRQAGCLLKAGTNGTAEVPAACEMVRQDDCWSRLMIEKILRHPVALCRPTIRTSRLGAHMPLER